MEHQEDINNAERTDHAEDAYHGKAAEGNIHADTAQGGLYAVQDVSVPLDHIEWKLSGQPVLRICAGQ